MSWSGPSMSMRRIRPPPPPTRGSRLPSPIPMQCGEVHGMIPLPCCGARPVCLQIPHGSSKIRSCRRAFGMRPMRNGSVSASCARRRSPPRRKCTGIGTAVWNGMNSEGRIALFFLFLIRGLAAGLHPYEAVEPHMGTLVRIKLYAAGEAEAQHAFRAAFDRIAQLDQVFSDYQPESELNRLCRAAAGRPVTVSRDLLRVLAASQQLAEESGGAFDITLGPVIRLWRQARREGKAPQEAALREAAARSGYRKLHLDLATGTAMLDQPGMQLDLGGIAKGDAADAALEVLAHLGIRRALVAVSGDLAFGDPPPDQAGWKIGIDPSDHADREWMRVLEL